MAIDVEAIGAVAKDVEANVAMGLTGEGIKGMVIDGLAIWGLAIEGETITGLDIGGVAMGGANDVLAIGGTTPVGVATAIGGVPGN